jgi:hypothetical protein
LQATLYRTVLEREDSVFLVLPEILGPLWVRSIPRLRDGFGLGYPSSLIVGFVAVARRASREDISSPPSAGSGHGIWRMPSWSAAGCSPFAWFKPHGGRFSLAAGFQWSSQSTGILCLLGFSSNATRPQHAPSSYLGRSALDCSARHKARASSINACADQAGLAQGATTACPHLPLRQQSREKTMV